MTSLTVQEFDAATLRAANPRYARMIPKWAKTVKMLAGIVLGVSGARARPRAMSAKQFNFRARRAHEADDLIQLRLQHGPLSRDAQAAFAVAIASVTDPARAVAWIRLFCPALDADELEDIITDAVFEPRRWTATQFGELLGLTKEERQRLGIRTIRAVGVTSRQMKLDRKRKHAERERARRARKPKAPPSIAKLKPWEAEGISRRTWYRRRANDVGTKRLRNIGTTILRTKVVPRATDRAAPARGHAMAAEGVGARYFPRPGYRAARAAPIFEGIPGVNSCASLR